MCAERAQLAISKREWLRCRHRERAHCFSVIVQVTSNFFEGLFILSFKFLLLLLDLEFVVKIILDYDFEVIYFFAKVLILCPHLFFVVFLLIS